MFGVQYRGWFSERKMCRLFTFNPSKRIRCNKGENCLPSVNLNTCWFYVVLFFPKESTAWSVQNPTLISCNSGDMLTLAGIKIGVVKTHGVSQHKYFVNRIKWGPDININIT